MIKSTGLIVANIDFQNFVQASSRTIQSKWHVTSLSLIRRTILETTFSSEFFLTKFKNGLISSSKLVLLKSRIVKMNRACLCRLGNRACRQRFETSDAAFRSLTSENVKSMVGSSKSLVADGGLLSKYPNIVDSSSLGRASIFAKEFRRRSTVTDKASRIEAGFSEGTECT